MDQIDRIGDGAEEDEHLCTQELQMPGENQVEHPDEEEGEGRILNAHEDDVVDQCHRNHRMITETVAMLPYGIEHHADDEHVAEASDGVFADDRCQFRVHRTVEDLYQYGSREPAEHNTHDVLRLAEHQEDAHQYVECEFNTECPVDAIHPSDAGEEVLQHGHVDQRLFEADLEVIHRGSRNDHECQGDGEHVRRIQADGPLDGEIGRGSHLHN